MSLTAALADLTPVTPFTAGLRLSFTALTKDAVPAGLCCLASDGRGDAEPAGFALLLDVPVLLAATSQFLGKFFSSANYSITRLNTTDPIKLDRQHLILPRAT